MEHHILRTYKYIRTEVLEPISVHDLGRDRSAATVRYVRTEVLTYSRTSSQIDNGKVEESKIRKFLATFPKEERKQAQALKCREEDCSSMPTN